MADQIAVEEFRGGLSIILEEIFEQGHGYMLDPGDAIFETLASITAEEASRPVSAQSACLAAQVNHVRFYMDVMMEGARSGEDRPADWAGSWRVGPVTDDEWRDLIERLRVTYGQVQEFARTFDGWNARYIGGAFALVGHCAYHLGEIRQGIGVLRSNGRE